LVKKYQNIAMLFCLILSNLIFTAEAKEFCCCKDDWSCHGSFYITGGYVFEHFTYSNNLLSFSPPNHATIFFTPRNAFPNNFSGMRLGFGSGLGNNTPFHYELDYNQLFTRSKTFDGLTVYRSSKALVTTLVYALNPKDRLRVVALGGTTVTSTYTTMATNFDGNFFSQTSNTVDVDPFLGAGLVLQINSKLAIRVVELVDIATYNRNVRDSLTTLLMLNFYPA
jgi:hypothetical protein